MRNCGLLLERRGRVMTCARQHSYDIARSGYINLLQPQDRRSLTAGDTLDAIQARTRLLNADVGRTVLRAVVERAVPLVPPDGVVVDLGSGSGDVLGELSTRTAGLGVGIDLSIEAVDYAVRRFPHITWIVANADRRLPLLDHTVDLILSVHGRRYPAECQRVLVHSGHLLVAVPAADDLIELRTAVQGQRVARERRHVLVAEHEEYFEVVEQFDARERRRVDRHQIRDLLRGTYRGARRSAAQTIESLDALDVTLASTIVVFRPRSR